MSALVQSAVSNMCVGLYLVSRYVPHIALIDLVGNLIGFDVLRCYMSGVGYSIYYHL